MAKHAAPNARRASSSNGLDDGRHSDIELEFPAHCRHVIGRTDYQVIRLGTNDEAGKSGTVGKVEELATHERIESASGEHCKCLPKVSLKAMFNRVVGNELAVEVLQED